VWSPGRRAALALAGALAIQLAFVASLVVAQADPEPHDVPVAVVGSPAAVDALRDAIERRQPGAFSLRPAASAERARDALDRREVYGVLILDPQAPRLLVASAGGPAVANVLRAAFGRLGPRPVAVRDVRPLDPGDPRGLLINLILLPLVVTAVLAPLFLRFLAPTVRGGPHLLALAIFALAGGLLTVAVASALPGSLLGLAALAALLLLAVSAGTTAFIAMRGVAGVGIGFLVFLIVGNVASGAAGAPELLPGFWRTVGEYLPPGAAATALRNAAYFPAASLLQPLLVLGAFVVAGAAVELVTGPRQAGRPLLGGAPAASKEKGR
jgi:hypothetical protein